MLRTNWKL